MERGHAEALLPLIDRVMARVEGGFASLDRVAVTVGPGSFTGLRVGIAAARAIGVACKIPVIGVSTLAALAAPLILEQKLGLVAVAIDARHGNVYFAAFGPDGRAASAPRIAAAARSGAVAWRGSGAARGIWRRAARHRGRGGRDRDRDRHEYADWTSFLLPSLGFLADPALAPPRPLYLKAPDAKLPGSRAIPTGAVVIAQ